MPSTAVINASASGVNHVITAANVPAGMCVRVLAWTLSFSAAVNANWQSSGGTVMTGLYYGGTDTVVNSPDLGLDTNRGQCQTQKGEGLDLNLSGAVAVGGHVVYEFVGQ